MRLLLAICLLVGRAWAAEGAAVPSPYAIDIPKWFHESFLDIPEELRDAARERKRVMLYFGQDGCPYCKALMKVNFGEADIVATTRRHFVPIALNIWGDREVTWTDGRKLAEKELARVLRVQYTPTLLFLDEGGRVALRLNGYLAPDKFRVALDYVSRRKEKEQTFADFQAGRAPAAAGGTLAPEPFFEKGSIDVPRIARESKRPVLVVFERVPCGDCDELHREGFKRPEVRKLLASFKVLQVDALGAGPVVAEDGRRETARDWAGRLQVNNTPTLVFFDAAAKEVFRVDGYVRPFHLASALDYVASGAYRGEPSFQRFVQQRADAQRAAGQAVDLWK